MVEAGSVSAAAERNHTAYVAVLTNTCIPTEWVVCVCVLLYYESISYFIYLAVLVSVFYVSKTLNKMF